MTVLKNYWHVSQKGFMTLEIMVAFAFMAICIVAVVAVIFSDQSIGLDAELNNQALYKAGSALEEARATAKSNFNSLRSQSGSSGIYGTSLLAEAVSPYAKHITSQVNWQSSMRPQKVELSTLVTDLDDPDAADTCNLFLTGDWQHPQMTTGSIDLGVGNIATDIDVAKGKAYMAVNSGTVSQNDFFVVDVSNVNNPVILKSINTGPGLKAVLVAGSYAYAANTSINGQLQIIDVSNPSSPMVVKNYKLPGVSGSGVGNSIFYSNKRIYLGTPKTTGPEFHIIDVSNPLAPFEIGFWETNTAVNDIYVKDNIAYLATPDTNQLRVLDIGTVSNIKEIQDFSPSSSATQSGNSLALLGDTVYLGRTVGGFNNTSNHELFTLDSTNALTALPKLDSKDIPGSVNGIFIRSGMAFLATGETAKEFQIWDVSRPQSLSQKSNLDLPADASAIDCEGNTMFVSLADHRGLEIIQPGP